MNPYCSHLNLPVNLNVDLLSYKKDTRNHVSRVPIDSMGAELSEILSKLNIEIQWVEIFYLGKDRDHSIHCDGHELDDKAKLNYVVGGQGSKMSWYEHKSEDKIEKRISPANTVYLGISTEDVIEVYSEEMQGLYLTQVGQFHNVWNKDDDRYCLSAYLADTKTKKRLHFKQLQILLKDYIDG
jgi:hypothetical protein